MLCVFFTNFYKLNSLNHFKYNLFLRHRKKFDFLVKMQKSHLNSSYPNKFISHKDNESPSSPPKQLTIENKKWIVNLTNIVVLESVLDILSLGNNFNFTYDLNKLTIFNFLKSLEFLISYNKLSADLREETLSILHQYLFNNI